MPQIIALTCLLAAFFFTATATKDWWETATFYQIYPRSFKDSDGDGIGDLKGIRQKLPYLKDIGVDAFWLSPIFASPMADFGYDISNFYAIQPEYGTMKDFDDLVAEAKELGIKVILDFVPNHSSDLHENFLKSENREPGYEDYYIWHPGKIDPGNSSVHHPPNNWLSVFRFSAWEWSEKRQEYYYHAFVKEQPDFNYRNPKVVEDMKNVLRFWLGKGVGGFRIDAVPNMFEVAPDENSELPDEPESGNSDDPQSHAYLDHIYTVDQPETIDMVYQWRKVMDDYQKEHGGDTRVIMTEAYSPLEIIKQYYGNGTVKGAHMPFNFQLLVNIKSSSTAEDFKDIIDKWMANVPSDTSSNWVMGNHDQRRIASRLGQNKVDAVNMILASLPGASVTYNGEEIGMDDVWISWEQTVDPQGCNTDPATYDKVSRDPARTPFQWDTTTSAGFSQNTSTWLPVSPDYRLNNVENQLEATRSHLKVFKQLREIRQTHTMRDGQVKIAVFNKKVLAILRVLPDNDVFVTVANLGGGVETINLASQFADLVPDSLKFALVDSSSHRSHSVMATTTELTLAGYETVVLTNHGRVLFPAVLLLLTALYSLLNL